MTTAGAATLSGMTLTLAVMLLTLVKLSVMAGALAAYRPEDEGSA